MKKLIPVYLTAFFLFMATSGFSQFSAMAGVYSGFGQTNYNMKGYDNTGFMPLGVRAAVGAYGVQLGLDYCSNVMNPKFNIKDTAGVDFYTDKIRNNYLGAMLRFHMGDYARDFAFILRGGGGMWFSEKDIAYSDFYKQNFALTDITKKYDNSVGFNGAMGFSIPVRDALHITLEGQFNYNERKFENQSEFHTSWCIQLGVSYNFFNEYNLGHY